MPLKTTATAITVLLLASGMLSGCAVGPDYKRVPSETPAQYKNAQPQAQSAPAAPDAWWTLFGDPILDDLERQVEVTNQNLKQADAAYRQAVAVVREQRAAFFPIVTLDASGTRFGGGRSTSSATLGGSSANVPLAPGAARQYQVSASASWELDVWGRLRRSLENASETAHASLADLAAARLSAQGQLATAYLQLREADAERRLLSATVQAYARTLEITRNRYAAGVAPRTDVLQAETQYYTAEDQEAALNLQRAQLENAIAALVGKPAGNFTLAQREEWNIPVPEIPAGVPSSLLERRPDIVGAERRVAAANATIGVQEAAYFPSLTLTGTYGFVSSTLSNLFQKANETHTIGLSAAQTVLDFGATRARVSAARAAYDQTVAAYRQTILTAFQDVENDLVSADILAKEFEFRRQASEAADLSEQLTLNQYKAGTVDYTTVVVQQAAALSARRSLAQIALSRQTSAVSLVTDLGGGWTAAK
jgi:NodT family efflux transporter outer membrane factor (OMF) lipoprotein